MKNTYVFSPASVLYARMKEGLGDFLGTPFSLSKSSLSFAAMRADLFFPYPLLTRMCLMVVFFLPVKNAFRFYTFQLSDKGGDEI